MRFEKIHDYRARMAHTALMYLYVGLFIGSLVASVLLPFCAAPWDAYRIRMSSISPADAERATYANAAMDAVFILYWVVFFVCQHSRRALHVWVQLVALAVIFGVDIGLGVLLERAAYESWFRAVALLDWMKAAFAFVFAVFLAVYTGVVHGRAGFKREFGPHWREAVPTRLPKDRGAQIAHIVLLSFLLAYTLVVFSLGCAFTSDGWEMKPPRGSGNVPHIILLVVLGLYNLYLAVYLWRRHASPQSKAVSVLVDVVVFPLFAVVLVALCGAVLGVLARDNATLGMFTACLSFAVAGFTLIIVAYEAIYTACHGQPGKWRRRFATAPAQLPTTTDVELEPRTSTKDTGAKNSRELSEHDRVGMDASPTLTYA